MRNIESGILQGHEEKSLILSLSKDAPAALQRSMKRSLSFTSGPRRTTLGVRFRYRPHLGGRVARLP